MEDFLSRFPLIGELRAAADHTQELRERDASSDTRNSRKRSFFPVSWGPRPTCGLLQCIRGHLSQLLVSGVKGKVEQ